MTVALMILAGSAGALARYEVSTWMQGRVQGRVQGRLQGRRPWGTAAVNLSGALGLGLLVGLLGDELTEWWVVAAGFGFFGGYTTFSTWMVESVQLLHEGRRGVPALALNVPGMLAAGAAGLLAGLAVGGWW